MGNTLNNPAAKQCTQQPSTHLASEWRRMCVCVFSVTDDADARCQKDHRVGRVRRAERVRIKSQNYELQAAALSILLPSIAIFWGSPLPQCFTVSSCIRPKRKLTKANSSLNTAGKEGRAANRVLLMLP